MNELVYINNNRTWHSDKKVQDIAIRKKTDKAIILVHGFSATSDTYSRWINALGKKNISIYTPNLYGHNTHFRDLESYGIKEHQKQILDLYNSIKDEYETIIIVGLSYGATIVLNLMTEKKFRKNTRFFLLAPSLDLVFSQKVLLYMANILHLKKTKFIAGNIANTNKILAYKDISIRSLMQFYRSITSVRTKLKTKSVKYNTTLFHSKKDKRSPLKTSIELYQNNKEYVKFIVLHKSKHELVIDYDNVRILEKIMNEI